MTMTTLRRSWRGWRRGRRERYDTCECVSESTRTVRGSLKCRRGGGHLPPQVAQPADEPAAGAPSDEPMEH